MPVYTKRVQTVLTDEQYELLRQISKERGQPLSALIREAIEAACFRKVMQERRRSALQKLLSLDAPVADWEQMEEEITQGVLETYPGARGQIEQK